MSQASEQFTNELDAVIHRWAQESDITVGEVVVGLECVKYNFMIRAFGDDR